jgi:curved DNA-binding protein CbpA
LKPRPINYYDLLGVSPAASYEEVRTAYRERISHYHPDRLASPHAHAVAALMNEAWEVLRDGDRRRGYDVKLQLIQSGAPAPPRPRRPAAATVTMDQSPISSGTDSNRRSSTRLKTLVTTSVGGATGARTEFTTTSTCVDLSVNGMAFTLDRTLAVGSAVVATLELAGRRLRVVATVVRAEPLRRAGRWKIAARFDQLSRSDSRRIAEYLAAEMGSRLE